MPFPSASGVLAVLAFHASIDWASTSSSKAYVNSAALSVVPLVCAVFESPSLWSFVDVWATGCCWLSHSSFLGMATVVRVVPDEKCRSVRPLKVDGPLVRRILGLLLNVFDSLSGTKELCFRCAFDSSCRCIVYVSLLFFVVCTVALCFVCFQFVCCVFAMVCARVFAFRCACSCCLGRRCVFD